ncbi:MAG TPA: ATP-binding protein [Flavobacterium sp.]|nr:ATP-binding protein [Flavobacterium sp.]
MKKINFRNPSLKVRIFLSMIFLTLISSVLIALVAVYQFDREAKTYHQQNLERKEIAVNEHINFVLSTSDKLMNTSNLPLIFQDKIHELSAIHNTQIDIYDLNGKLLISSKGNFNSHPVQPPEISQNILRIIESTPSKRFVDLKLIDGVRHRSAYNYIRDPQFKPLGIVNLPYIEDTTFYDEEMKNFLIRFSQIYLFVFLLSIVIAYFLSTYITRTLQMISEHLQQTQITRKNKKIKVDDASYEISSLIDSYNNMVDLLEESATKLAQSERESAWREMARQVAHEIKNPLTPMRLTVQSFQRRFNPEDPEIHEKINDFSKTMIQQIDTMSSVASAFSNFASMPAQKNETLNIVEVVELALEIFNQDYIRFESEKDEIITTFDQAQIIRVITNLVKNAMQAIPDYEPFPSVRVKLYSNDEHVIIEVKDNGVGIPPEIQAKIFEPKFTTKTSGMGLGLAMIKNIVESYQGSITFESVKNKGTVFYVQLPITQK